MVLDGEGILSSRSLSLSSINEAKEDYANVEASFDIARSKGDIYEMTRILQLVTRAEAKSRDLGNKEIAKFYLDQRIKLVKQLANIRAERSRAIKKEEDPLEKAKMIHSLRTPQSQRIDESIKAETIYPPEKVHEWAKQPHRTDIKGVDTPEIKVIKSVKPTWKKRDLDKMSIESLQDYFTKLDKAYEKVIWSEKDPFKVKRKEALRTEREKVGALIEKRKEEEKDRLLQLVRSNKITYDDVPKQNPFPYHYGTAMSKKEEEEEDKHWEVSPIFGAKEMTDHVIENKEALGQKVDKEEIFRKCLEYEKRPFGEKDKRPYDELFELRGEAYRFSSDVENTIEKMMSEKRTSELTKEQVLKNYPESKHSLIKLAFIDLKERSPFTFNKTIQRKEPLEYKETKPETKGFRILENLGALDRTYPTILKIEQGRGKTSFLDSSHVSLFDGSILMKDIDLPDGDYIIENGFGDKIAYSNPDIFAFDKAKEELVFLKFDVKRKGEDAKSKKEYRIPLKKATGKEEEEQYPLPKFRLTERLRVKAGDLEKLLKTKDAHSVRLRSDGRSILFGLQDYMGNSLEPSLVGYTDGSGDVKVLESSGGLSTAQYDASYLRNFLKGLDKKTEIEMAFTSDMPTKLSVKEENIEGDFYLAPRIGV